jgi:hypothetical protein
VEPLFQCFGDYFRTGQPQLVSSVIQNGYDVRRQFHFQTMQTSMLVAQTLTAFIEA